jgi:hypothetical protein
MSLETGESTSIQTPESFSSWQVWKTIFAHPKVESYQTLIDDPKAGIGRGLRWVVLSNLLGYSLMFLPAVMIFGALGLGLLLDRESIALGIGVLVFTGLLIPLMVFWTVTAGLFYTGVCHLVARLLGGAGPYGKLYYLYAAYLAPFTAIMGVLYLVPFLSLVLVPVAWYSIYIQIVAVKTVHRISWEKSIAVIAVPFLANFAIMGGFFVLYLIVMIALFFFNSAGIIPDIIQTISAFAH